MINAPPGHHLPESQSLAKYVFAIADDQN
jgi:hypothetical protein